MKEGHVFRCVLCQCRFTSDQPGGKCPDCGSRTLVHEAGQPLKGKKCSGFCSGCSGCSH